MSTYPTFDQLGVDSTHANPLNNIDGAGTTHRAWMAAVGLDLDRESGLRAFVFEQDAPLATWTIAHGFGCFPTVTTVDTLGREFEGAVTYVDADTLTVNFATPQVGKAYLA